MIPRKDKSDPIECTCGESKLPFICHRTEGKPCYHIASGREMITAKDFSFYKLIQEAISDGEAIQMSKHPFWPGAKWYVKVWKWLSYFFVRPKFSKEALEPAEKLNKPCQNCAVMCTMCQGCRESAVLKDLANSSFL